MNDTDVGNAHELAPGYLCTCQVGARTVGRCAHVAAILWFLGYVRHQNNVKYPNDTLLITTLDAIMRAEGEAEETEVIELVFMQ